MVKYIAVYLRKLLLNNTSKSIQYIPDNLGFMPRLLVSMCNPSIPYRHLCQKHNIIQLWHFRVFDLNVKESWRHGQALFWFMTDQLIWTSGWFVFLIQQDLQSQTCPQLGMNYSIKVRALSSHKWIASNWSYCLQGKLPTSSKQATTIRQTGIINISSKRKLFQMPTVHAKPIFF